MESGFGVDEADRQKIRRILTRRLALADIACLVVPSRGLVHLATRSWGIRRDRIEYIPNGVDWQRFQDAAAAASGRRGREPIVLGTVAPLRPEKNLPRLLRAFANLPATASTQLRIVGDGSERVRLESLAASLGLGDRVKFEGHSEAVEEHLSQFDVFVMSSDTEQMPNSLIQAMAAGLPVVATDVGDVASTVAPENAALIVPKDDQPGFVAALASIIDNGELRRRLGALNSARALANFTEARMFAAYQPVDEVGCG